MLHQRKLGQRRSACDRSDLKRGWRQVAMPVHRLLKRRPECAGMIRSEWKRRFQRQGFPGFRNRPLSYAVNGRVRLHSCRYSSIPVSTLPSAHFSDVCSVSTTSSLISSKNPPRSASLFVHLPRFTSIHPVSTALLWRALCRERL